MWLSWPFLAKPGKFMCPYNILFLEFYEYYWFFEYKLFMKMCRTGISLQLNWRLLPLHLPNLPLQCGFCMHVKHKWKGNFFRTVCFLPMPFYIFKKVNFAKMVHTTILHWPGKKSHISVKMISLSTIISLSRLHFDPWFYESVEICCKCCCDVLLLLL